MTVAAIVAIVLLALLWPFQVALALGAPWGRAAFGGQHEGVLPPHLRIVSGVSAVLVYPFVGLFILASADLIDADWIPGTGAVGMWVLAGLFGLSAVANFVSRSKVERIWGPVSLAIAICCGIIAASI